MTLFLHWKGIAVSENKRLAPGRKRFRGGDEYKAFKAGMTLMFRSQAHGQTFARPNARIRMSITDRMDKTNLGKAIFDAIEKAGIVKNDRVFNHGFITWEPIRKHRTGEDDEIEIYLYEGNAE